MDRAIKPANPVKRGDVVVVKRTASPGGLWQEVALAYVTQAWRDGKVRKIRIAGTTGSVPIEIDDVMTVGGVYQEFAKRLADGTHAPKNYPSPTALRDEIVRA